MSHTKIPERFLPAICLGLPSYLPFLSRGWKNRPRVKKFRFGTMDSERRSFDATFPEFFGSNVSWSLFRLLESRRDVSPIHKPLLRAVISIHFIFFSTQGPRNERVGESDERVCGMVSTPLLGRPIGKVAQVTSSFRDRAAITLKARVRTAGQDRDTICAVLSTGRVRISAFFSRERKREREIYPKFPPELQWGFPMTISRMWSTNSWKRLTIARAFNCTPNRYSCAKHSARHRALEGRNGDVREDLGDFQSDRFVARRVAGGSLDILERPRHLRGGGHTSRAFAQQDRHD